MKQIALYGGSFNPPTIAHRNIGLTLLTQLPIDEVWYLVSPQNPFKSAASMASFDDRVAMTRLNLTDHPQLVVQEIEATYLTEVDAPQIQTADTLRFLQRDFPEHQFIWTMGADNLHEFHLWDDADFITDNFPIVIIPRKNYTESALQSVTAKRLSLAAAEITASLSASCGLYLLKTEENAIAATHCRKELAEGQVPAAVRPDVAEYALQKKYLRAGKEMIVTNGTHFDASICIIELNLADAMQQVYDSKSLPVTSKLTSPRKGGLTENIIKALEKRAPGLKPDDVYGTSTVTLFAREKKLVFDTSVAARDVFVVLDYALPDATQVSAEFFLLANTLATDAYISLAQQAGQAANNSGARSVHLIMPSYAYARQDKAHGERGPISAAITAQNLEPYYDSVTSVHLHSPAIQGMFRAIPLAEISPNEIYTPSFVCRDPETFEPIAAECLTLEGVNHLFDKICIVSPDAGGAKNARDFLKYCKKFAAVTLGVSEDAIIDLPMAQIDKRRSGPNVSEVMNVLGTEYIRGRQCVIIDDMGDTFGTAAHAAQALQDAGATSIEFWGTHGYFSGDDLKRINQSPVARVSITNSTSLPLSVIESEKISVLDIAPVMAQVIIDHNNQRRIQSARRASTYRCG